MILGIWMLYIWKIIFNVIYLFCYFLEFLYGLICFFYIDFFLKNYKYVIICIKLKILKKILLLFLKLEEEILNRSG